MYAEPEEVAGHNGSEDEQALDMEAAEEGHGEPAGPAEVEEEPTCILALSLIVRKSTQVVASALLLSISLYE